METMKAWVSKPSKQIDDLCIETQGIPQLQTDEILVQVKAAALNYSDLLMIQGRYQVRPPPEFIPGQEISGIVQKVGGESRFVPGDRVASKVLWGGFSEYVVVSTKMAMKIPDSIQFVEASALPIAYPTAIVALTDSVNLTPDDTVLIHAAAGGTGIAAIQIACAKGATVIGTAGSEEKCQLARDFGAHHCFNYRNEDWPNQVKAVTEDKGASVIFDSVGGEVTTKSLRCVERKGTLLVVGFSSGEIPQIPANLLLLKRASAKGVYWNHDLDSELLEEIERDMKELLESGAIRPYVQKPYCFEDLPLALSDLKQRRSVGKLVLQMNDKD